MPVSFWVTAGVTGLAVVICVSLHYEALRLIGKMPLPVRNHRARIVFLILGLLGAHIAEIWVFGAGYYVLLSFGDHGALTGNGAMSLLDCVYYSATVFTTLGFGDIVPSGPLRFMTGTEAIAGLTIITWSASYTFLVMNRTWHFND